jgi:hypothetical protein
MALLNLSRVAASLQEGSTCDRSFHISNPFALPSTPGWSALRSLPCEPDYCHQY